MEKEITLETMSEEYFDVLKELGNIGAGNATTALAQLLNCKVDMQVPQVRLLDFKDLGAAIGGEERLVAGIYLGVEGDITGHIMFFLEKGSARHLVSKLMGMELEGEEFNEMEISALKEIGNIIAGSYLSALSTMTNLVITPSIPYIAVDMAAAILSVPAIQFGQFGDNALLIETEFGDDVMMEGYFILLPDEDSYDKILQSLGISL